jgi:hypothetical protein
VLARCDLCGCLVVGSTLRARDFLTANRTGILRRAVQLVCADAAACYARSLEPERWALVGAAVPMGEPEVGAALLRCQVCDVAATVGELSISRERDEEGWWGMAVCADRVGCEARQRIGPGRIDFS